MVGSTCGVNLHTVVRAQGRVLDLRRVGNSIKGWRMEAMRSKATVFEVAKWLWISSGRCHGASMLACCEWMKIWRLRSDFAVWESTGRQK